MGVVNPRDLAESVGKTPFIFSPWLVDQMDQWIGDYGLDTSVL